MRLSTVFILTLTIVAISLLAVLYTNACMTNEVIEISIPFI